MGGNWDIAPNLSRHRPKNSLKIFCHFYLGRGRCGTGGAVCATATMQQAYKMGWTAAIRSIYNAHDGLLYTGHCHAGLPVYRACDFTQFTG